MSSQAPGPALVAAMADADPVTLLVAAWLSARRSENTRAAYARDIGIAPHRRPSRAPSWLDWCHQHELYPVTGVTALHVSQYARHLDDAGLSPASTARKLAAISSWYGWLARRGHITASPAVGVATEATELVPGEVAACAWRENTSMMTSIPAARIATCTARRATCRKTGCSISSSRTTRTDQTRFQLPAISGPKHTNRT